MAPAIVLVLILTAVFPASCQAECGMSNITACKNQQAAFNPSLPTPWTDEHYNEFCRKADLFRSCVDKLSCTSSDTHYVDYQKLVGVAIGDEYLCSAAARQVFLANQACFTARLSLTTSFCRRITYPLNYSSLSQSEKCRLEHDFYQCVYKSMESGCNEDIANAIVQFNTRKYTPPRVATINCNLTTWNYTVDTLPSSCSDCNCSVQSLATCRRLIPQSPDFATLNIDEICRKQLGEFTSCVNTLNCPEDYALRMDLERIQGVKDGYVYMCGDHVKPAIKDNQACIASAVSSVRVLTNINANDVCRNYDEHFLNVFKSVKSKCDNEEVATMVTRTLVKRTVPFIDIVFGCHLSGGARNCRLVEIFHCMSYASHSPSLPIFSSDEDYDSFCNKTERLKSYISGVSCSENDDIFTVHQTVVGLSDGEEYLCSDSARPVIESNQACLAANLSSIVSNCSQSFSVTDASTSSRKCKSHNSQNKCVYDALKTDCNDDTAEVVVLFHIKKKQPHLLASIDCQLDKSYLANPNSASPSSTVSAVQSLIGVLVYLMYYD